MLLGNADCVKSGPLSVCKMCAHISSVRALNIELWCQSFWDSIAKGPVKQLRKETKMGHSGKGFMLQMLQ